jgi:restriction system protein
VLEFTVNTTLHNLDDRHHPKDKIENQIILDQIMSRGKKSHAANDILAIFSLLPWWLCVALALISYYVLHHYATPLSAQDMAGFKPGHMAGTLTKSVVVAIAMTGQYLVPGLLVVAAALSVLRQHKRRKLVQDLSHSKSAQPLHSMSWKEFEMLVGQGFRQKGYRVFENERAGPDGGVDLVLFKNGEKHLVQCKQWRAYRVGVEVVRELYGLMAASGAAGGFVVTSGRFTSEARSFAQGRNIKLMDGALLVRFFAPTTQRANASPRSGLTNKSVVPLDQVAAAPTCPKCQAPMARRMAKTGHHAGQPFWGCTHFPTCRGTLPFIS